MNKPRKLNFTAHAHIKNIIGQDMINDDNIAVKELVKNGMDADATKVTVSFKNTANVSDDSEITVLDNGSGMSIQDIKEKWANMAYSSKRTDENRSYAGNKGIGRFSADRLGKVLHLYTKQKSTSQIIKIKVDWKDFENKNKWNDLIGEIDFHYVPLTKKEFERETEIKGFSHGTFLRILQPRYDWSFDKISNLKNDLKKFMIPKLVHGGTKFALFLDVSGYEVNQDESLSGKIKNQVFNKLPFKTSYITSSIDADGKNIQTKIYHRGNLLVNLKEKNNYDKLKDVNIVIFHLNSYHKAFFKKETGMRSVEYGSIFLYLNGFRVPPYGEHENDWLGVDRRHGQGHSRSFGLRDILGRIELKDSLGDTYELTSDREGIKRNDAFRQLINISNGYFNHILKKLETLVADGLFWDKTVEDYSEIERRLKDYSGEFDNFETNYESNESEKEKNLVSVLRSIARRGTRESDIVSLNLGQRASKILGEERRGNVKKSLAKSMKYSAFIEIIKDKSNLKEKLKVAEKRRLFAEANTDSDAKKLKEIIHLTGLWGKRIEYNLGKVLYTLRNTAGELPQKTLIAEIESSQMLSAKIRKLSRLITKANFALMSDRIRLDIFSYIAEYIEEIKNLGPYATGVKVNYSNKDNVKLLLNMSAIEVAMLVDNIIINAEKHAAKNLYVFVVKKNSRISIAFEDDGKGLTDKYSPKDLFEAGITTTSGSGIGLYHVKRIAEELESKVTIKNNASKGATVTLEWKK